MVITRYVTSNVYFRSGALTPPFLGGLGWPDHLLQCCVYVDT